MSSYSLCGVNECHEPAVMRLTIQRAGGVVRTQVCCLHHLRFASGQVELFARQAEQAGYAQSADWPPELARAAGIEPAPSA